MGNAEKKLLGAVIWKCTRLRPQQIKGQDDLVLFTEGHLFVVCQYAQRTSSLKLQDRFNYFSYADFRQRKKKDV